MPVLVLDGHSRAAIETVQSLGRAGLEIDVAAESLACTVMLSRYPARKLSQPPLSPAKDFHRWLDNQDRQRHYELIVPATEASLLFLRLLPESDSMRRRAVLPRDEALDTALDKYKTWQVCRTLGVPTPGSILLSSDGCVDPPENYPVVLKPVHSKIMVDGELRTVAPEIVRNQHDYRKQIERWLPYTPVLQQEYVFGRGVGVEFLFDRGKKLWHFVHERVHELPLSGGASSYRRSVPPVPALLADAEKVLAELEWHGVAMVEFRVDDRGQHWLLEINPRLWGSLALAIDAGVDFPLGLWRLAQGLTNPPQPSYRTYYYSRDLKNDAEWFKANIHADGRDSLLLTKSTLLSLLELLRPLAGRESWDHFDFHDLALTRTLLRTTAGEQLRTLYRKLCHPTRKRSLEQHHQT